MARAISVDQLSNEVTKALQEFSQEINNETKKAVRKVAADARKEISKSAPVRKGKYAKGWATKVVYEDSKDIRMMVYARRPHYALTHLLEKGHAKRGGGRVAPRVHIAPAEEQAKDELVKIIERKIK